MPPYPSERAAVSSLLGLAGMENSWPFPLLNSIKAPPPSGEKVRLKGNGIAPPGSGGTENSLIVPVVVMRPRLLSSRNHSAPSGASFNSTSLPVLWVGVGKVVVAPEGVTR